MAAAWHPIATIHNDYTEKFGIPRQSGCVPELKSVLIFEPPYREPSAFRGLEEYSHIWLIWEFSEAIRDKWSATVRPPRLGGNTRLGVFATRSPFRPNPIGLSCVTLESIDWSEQYGPVLTVGGADLMDKTPIYDIKPYLPYADAHPEASGGFTRNLEDTLLDVDIPQAELEKLPLESRAALGKVLAQDPRPRYQDDERVYGMSYAGHNVKFQIVGGKLTVLEIE